MKAFAACILLVCVGIGVARSETIESKIDKNILAALLVDDESVFLDHGNSTLGSFWGKYLIPWVDAPDIAQQYLGRPIGADQFYGSRYTFVHGTFISSDNWIGDKYRVQMQAFVALVSKSDASFLSGASSGSAVEMACKITGKELDGFIYGDGCIAPYIAMETIAMVVATTPSIKDVGLDKVRSYVSKIANWDGVRNACSDEMFDPKCMNAIKAQMDKKLK
jgi:hypothetical protein